MITPSFSLTATERVLPRLALDFTTASLDPRVTFTRAGNTATVVNSSGLVAPINADLPRFDYDPLTLICKGLLIEESRANLCLYSQDFRNTTDAGATRPWNYTNITLSADSTAAPDSTTTADTIIETEATGAHRNFQSFTLSNATAYTFSVFAKAKERTRIAIISSDGVTARGTGFNLSNGTSFSVGLTSPTSGSITNYGNGWYKCSITYTTGGTACNFQIYLVDNSNQTSYAGDGSSGAYVWGAQLEAGSFATSYIPTEASQVTRTADVATMTGTNFSDWYNQSEGTFTSRYTPSMTSAAANIIRGPVIVDGGSFNESINIGVLSGQNGMRVYDGGAELVNMLKGTISANVNYQIAGAYKLNDYAVAVNGGAVTTDTSATVPTPDRLAIGRYVTGGTFFSGLVQNIMYWPMRLTNAEVQAFSKQG